LAIAQSAIVAYNQVMKRVFKTKTFDRWARKVVSDVLLCQAAREIELGLFEADLGGGVCKKRVAIAGQGKSGSTRTLVAKKHQSAIYFLAGREKNAPGTDFSDKEVSAAKIIAQALENANSTKLDELVANEILKEICHVK
jgi:hypothetical protein